MSGLVPAAVLDRRSDLSCPQDNGTIWSANGYSWDILCNYDFPGNDLIAAPASSFTECLDACNNYKQNEQYLNGASCVAVVYGAGNPNGDPCYLKAKIDTVGTGNYMQYVARRTQYTIGQDPIFTSIAPSASATSAPAAQASTSASRILSSAAIPISTAIANTRDALSSTSSTTSPPLVSGSETSSDASSPPGPSPPATVTVTKDGTTQTITTATATAASTPSTSSSTKTNTPPAAASTSSSTASTPTQTPSSSSPSPSSSNNNSNLSDPAKIGLGIGLGLLALLLLSLTTYVLLSRRRRRRHHRRRTLQNPPLEQDASSELPSTSASRSTILTPGAEYGEKPHLVSRAVVAELGSPQPAAGELEAAKVFELSGRRDERV